MILYIDTTEKNFELRLYEGDGAFVDNSIAQSEANHSEELIPEIDVLLKKHVQSLLNIQKIFVISGPGSYTGLRVGVSTANGLAFASNIPVFGIKKDSKDEFEAAVQSKLSIFGSPAEVYYERAPHITASKR